MDLASSSAKVPSLSDPMSDRSVGSHTSNCGHAIEPLHLLSGVHFNLSVTAGAMEVFVMGLCLVHPQSVMLPPGCRFGRHCNPAYILVAS